MSVVLVSSDVVPNLFPKVLIEILSSFFLGVGKTTYIVSARFCYIANLS
jgi:hypothetical protein